MLGDYEFNTRFCIGQGSFGKVYQAIDRRRNINVAIKELYLQNIKENEQLFKMLKREASIIK